MGEIPLSGAFHWGKWGDPPAWKWERAEMETEWSEKGTDCIGVDTGHGGLGEIPLSGAFHLGNPPAWRGNKIVGVVLVVVIWNGMWEKFRHLV